jgi:hypothetical protein
VPLPVRSLSVLAQFSLITSRKILKFFDTKPKSVGSRIYTAVPETFAMFDDVGAFVRNPFAGWMGKPIRAEARLMRSSGRQTPDGFIHHCANAKSDRRHTKRSGLWRAHEEGLIRGWVSEKTRHL